MNAYAAFPTAAERAALARISRAAPKHRRVAQAPGKCLTTKFVNGVAQEPVEEVAPTGTPAEVTVSWLANGYGNYGSVRKAFADLGLPDNKHVKFRAELKRAGSKVFSFNGVDYLFKVAE